MTSPSDLCSTRGCGHRRDKHGARGTRCNWWSLDDCEAFSEPVPVTDEATATCPKCGVTVTDQTPSAFYMHHDERCGGELNEPVSDVHSKAEPWVSPNGLRHSQAVHDEDPGLRCVFDPKNCDLHTHPVFGVCENGLSLIDYLNGGVPSTNDPEPWEWQDSIYGGIHRTAEAPTMPCEWAEFKPRTPAELRAAGITDENTDV